ncbi:cobyrinate a,c-diamide synthase [Verrucomicrobiota bacterium]
MKKTTKAFVIAAPSSGAGKTTLTMGIIAALRKRGLIVQPFKVGPDYIDPAYHSALAGRACINLDSWMTSPEFVRDTFERHAADADVAVIEGVMGLFDGKDKESSSAHVAKLLGLPVLMVVDAKKAAQSTAALLYGFEHFDPDLNVSGALFNCIASENHWNCVSDAVRSRCKSEIFGYLRKNPELILPERQLGLLSAHEHGVPTEFIEKLVTEVEANIDLNALLTHLPALELATPAEAKVEAAGTRLGIAKDEAFCFYYQDNLDLLQQAGIELVEFSPLYDTHLPENVDGLYFGGGFPEEFAGTLAQNSSMLSAVRNFEGKIIAECGGLIYLCKDFTGLNGEVFELVGRINGRIEMTEKLQACGYREVTFTNDTLLGPKGTVLRGHEFHWSKWSDQPKNFGALQTGDRNWGIADENLLASYFHIHFGSNPRALQHLKAVMTPSVRKTNLVDQLS